MTCFGGKVPRKKMPGKPKHRWENNIETSQNNRMA
jgi:hypothetical protein